MNEATDKNWLHLDLKGAIPSAQKLKEQLVWFKEAGFNGIVWEHDARQFWQDNELSEEEEFMATHINLVRREILELLVNV